MAKKKKNNFNGKMLVSKSKIGGSTPPSSAKTLKIYYEI